MCYTSYCSFALSRPNIGDVKGVDPCQETTYSNRERRYCAEIVPLRKMPGYEHYCTVPPSALQPQSIMVSHSSIVTSSSMMKRRIRSTFIQLELGAREQTSRYMSRSASPSMRWAVC